VKRRICSTVSLGLILVIIAGCAQTTTPEVVEQVVTQVVPQIVKETVIVEGTPQVVEKEVTKVVEVEVVVTATPPAVPQRTVVVAFGQDAPSLDPQLSATSMAVNVSNTMFDTLVRRDTQTMNLVPGLAESWEIVDPVTYVFKLREGVRFHNGEEFTASDVVFTFERLFENEDLTVRRHAVSTIESFEAIDDYTVQFNLKAPNAPFLARLPTFHIIPEDYIKAVGGEEFNRQPVGTGPYKFVEWVHDDHLTLEANEDYWDGAPEIKHVQFKPIPEDSTRVAALLAGEVDVIENVPAEDVPRLIKDEDVRLEMTTDNYHYFIQMNSNEPPFDNVLFRKAVNYAIDWDTILQLFGGYAFRVPIPLIPGIFSYEENADYLMQFAYDYDPAKARELLAEAGYPDGVEVTLDVGSGRYPRFVEVAQAVAAQLNDVGIQTNVRADEWLTFYERCYTNRECTMILFVMGNPIYDPDHLMSIHFDGERSTTRFFVTPELTELAQRGMKTVDSEERVQVYRDAIQLIMEQAAYVWGYGVERIYGVRADIAWKPPIDAKMYPQDMSFLTR
jgi:peptide/nickel transport system substrate-binding protein